MVGKEILIRTDNVIEAVKKVRKLAESVNTEYLADTVSGENDGDCQMAIFKLFTNLRTTEEICQKLMLNSCEYMETVAKEYENTDLNLANTMQ